MKSFFMFIGVGGLILLGAVVAALTIGVPFQPQEVVKSISVQSD